MRSWLKGVSVLATLGTFIILLMGALVTKTGSGEGCGNTWPFCNGEVFPTYHTLASMIEYSHRIVSGLVGLIVVILSVWAWRAYRENKAVKFFAFNSVFFIVLQGLLGAAAVVWGQSDAVLALHFGFSLVSFASVALLAVLVFRLDRDPGASQSKPAVSRGVRTGIWGLTVFTYLVVYTGAYVRHTGSSLGCASWPLCDGVWLPDFTTQPGVQMLHRWFAAAMTVFVVWLYIAVRKYYPHRADLRRGAFHSLWLTAAQVLTGGLIVLTKLELMIALLHTTLISAFFAALCYLCMQAGIPWRRYEHVESPVK
ncbi:heme A synthase [Marinithermofilum abyssi]|uniref:Heme A synthase n=1 Tax=Marinithermofilum abyssi TaxID=1571185 RepID=A0A8J2VEJ5_9BACL|nr:heme A synthase [Marinithermofilum abyssi]GGE10905.1 heme A synthase [Marinithermofilum abyssi]